jgi:hypothetical protein
LAQICAVKADTPPYYLLVVGICVVGLLGAGYKMWGDLRKLYT